MWLAAARHYGKSGVWGVFCGGRLHCPGLFRAMKFLRIGISCSVTSWEGALVLSRRSLSRRDYLSPSPPPHSQRCL